MATGGPPPTISSPERPGEQPAPAAPAAGAPSSSQSSPAIAGGAPIQGPAQVGVGPPDPATANLQRWLKAIGYWSGAIDGVWTDFLSQELKQWQTKVGLEATGRLDDATTAKLDEIGRFVAAAAPTATAPTPAPASGGTVAVTDAAVAGSLGGAPNPDGKFGIPGGGEIWHVDGKDWFVVYRVPGTSTPLAWKIDDADLPAIFGPGVAPKADRELNGLQAFAEGPLVFGSSRLLANTSEHPFDAFVANFQTEAASRPWLRDPEILALTTRALLENRTVTDAELAGTDWWKTHTSGERAWIAEFNRDPATAQQKITDGRDQVRRLLQQSGVYDPPETLVTWLGDRMTAGTWSQAYVYGQIAKIADPFAPGDLDPAIKPLLDNLTLDTQADNITKVDELLNRWLGPVFASTWTKDQKESWAGRLRNDPNGETTLIEELKRQRLSLFPEYENPNLSYEDIASPWRGIWTQTWGEAPDETDPLFNRIVRTNDLSQATEILRTEGLQRGNGTVTQSLLSAVGTSDMGSTVRRAS